MGTPRVWRLSGVPLVDASRHPLPCAPRSWRVPEDFNGRTVAVLNDAALTTGATAIKNEITHFQLHSTNVGGAWGTNAVGSRVAVSGSVDSDGDITWTNVSFTGLTPNQAVGGVSYWTAGSGGSNRGGTGLTGDATANSAGDYTVVSVTETATSS